MAFITDSLAIRQILDHLDLSPPEKPPPEIRDLVRVPVDDEGRAIVKGFDDGAPPNVQGGVP